MSFILIIVWISLRIYITWKSSGTDIATLSLQLTILETMLAVGGILLAIAGLLGYQEIKRYLDKSIAISVKNEVEQELGKRNLTQYTEECSSSSKERESNNI